jgi:type I restriction enzyme, S subunit
MPEAGWTDRSIGDCVDASFAGEWGGEPNPQNAVVLRATDIDDAGHVVGAGAARSIPMSKLRAKQLQDGDILVEGSGGGPGKPVGRVALFEANAHGDRAICSNFFKTLRPKRSAVNERFLWRKLGWFYSQPALLALQQQTTGIINLKFAEYLDARIDVPSELIEQAKIAEVLDTLDTTIRQTEAIIEKLKQVKQGLLHDLLTRGIDANGELRPPQSEAPHLYKDSPLGRIPVSWKASSVSEACDLHNGLRLPLAGDVREKMLGEFAYYGPTGILDYINEFRAEGTFVLLGEDGDHFLKFADRPMTQLVSGRFNVNNHAHLLSGRQCRTEWVDVWFRHRDITLFLTRQGAGRFKLNKASLLSLPLAVPSDREQALALDALASMECRIATEQRVRDKFAMQKSGLMDDLLTGRVRVTPLLADATN